MGTAWSPETIDSVAEIATEKIGLDDLTVENYISTENMLPDKQGVKLASKLPTSGNVNAFRTGDVLFSNIRTYFKKVWLATRNGGSSADVVIFRSRSTRKTHNKFLYYLLSSDAFIESTVTASKGTKMPRGDKDAMRAYTFCLPPLSSQERIAGILSAYDELIENSQRRINILESMARALYREWFVYFRYPGHESVPLVPSALGDIPQGWEVKPFSALASYVNGYPFKPAQLGIEGKPIIKIKELKGGIIADTPRNPGYGIPEKYNIYDGDVLFSWSADLDTYLWMGGEGFINQHLFTVLPSDYLSLAYCFHALKEAMPRFRALSLGATMHHIKRSALDQIFTVVGPAATRERFESLVEPIHHQLITLTRHVTNLRATRELLLPRLLSGRIDVFRQDEEGAA